MPEQSSGENRKLESEVLKIVTRQLDQTTDPAERAKAYGILENLIQRDCELERARQEKELQLDLRGREDQYRSAKRIALSMLGLSVIVFTAGVTLALRGFQDIGLFLLGCTAAFLGEALVGYR